MSDTARLSLKRKNGHTPLVTTLVGHCLDLLQSLPANSVQTVVTSPPYWGLRDYGTPPVIWKPSSQHPNRHLFPKCQHRFGPRLPRTGSVFRNGKSGSTAFQNRSDKALINETVNSSDAGAFCSLCGAWLGSLGQEPFPDLFVEHLVLIFREVRRVLKSDGTLWLNLGDTYAAERNGTHMPAETLAGGKSDRTPDGSCVNRGRSAGVNPSRQASVYGLKHKDLVGIPWRTALALQSDGWWLRQDIIWSKPNPMPESVTDRCTKAHEYIFLLTKSDRYYFDHSALKEPATGRSPGNTGPTKSGRAARSGDNHHRTSANLHLIGAVETRNRRSVWNIPVQPFRDAHFATFPLELVRLCLQAGSAFGDLVLDPFSGAATTGCVCLQEGRQYLGLEQNLEYARMGHKRMLSVYRASLTSR